MAGRAVGCSGRRDESLAGLLANHPDRFGFFTNVATFHADLAIQQVGYALDIYTLVVGQMLVQITRASDWLRPWRRVPGRLRARSCRPRR